MNFILMAETTITEQAPVAKYSPEMAKILSKDIYGNALGADGNPIVATPAATITPPATPNTPEAPPATPPAKTAEDLDAEEDARFLAKYNKIHKTNFETIEDISKPTSAPTKEELEAAQRSEETEAFEWALSTEKFKKEDYDKAVVTKSKDKIALALELFTEEYLLDNKGATAAEAEEKFKDYYALDESDTSWKKIKGLKDIDKIVSNHLKQYENIDNHVESYRQYKTVAEKERAFKGQLKTAVNNLPETLTFEIPVEGKSEKASYTYPITPDLKDDILKEYTKNKWAFDAFDAGKKEVKEKDLSEAMLNTLRAKHAVKMIEHIASEHGKAMRQGLLAELSVIPDRKPATSILGAQPKPQPKVVERSAAAKERGIA